MSKDYWEQDAKLRAEVIFDNLCFSVPGRDDLKILPSEDGHVEIAFFTNLDVMEEVALVILERVRASRRAKAKKEKEAANAKNN